ncbi:MAG: XdhC family protein [Christensenellaceae bacterium]|jgi:xanthine dehydrogenase accessory factor|nr:XdhC family protein [Christensenellaceae bacterium]
MQQIYAQLLQCLQAGKQAALITDYADGQIGRRLILEGAAAWAALPAHAACIELAEGQSSLMATEYYAPKPRLVILGGGHVALPLAAFGAKLGFDVAVFDDRPSFASAARFPDARAVVCDGFENMHKRVQLRRSDYVVIVTRGHRHDMLCLRQILANEFPCYVGMIGSRRRVAIVKQQLQEETGAAEKLAQLHAPIGLPIGAVTPEEISISILAQVIARRRLELPAENSVAIDPDMDLLAWLAGGQTKSAALITVLSSQGSTPRGTGAKMAVLPDGRLIGSVGGGCAEAEALRRARDIALAGGYCRMEVDMTDSAEDDGMVCGGSMQVLIEAL